MTIETGSSRSTVVRGKGLAEVYTIWWLAASWLAGRQLDKADSAGLEPKFRLEIIMD